MTTPTRDDEFPAAGVDQRPGISASAIVALEDAWTAIRTRHPELPAVVIVLGAGSGQCSGALKLGHFAALRWTTTDSAKHGEGFDGANGSEPLAEVFVGGEGLARGPGEVLATLLHEAAHALADVREIKDTSRQGRWHNAKFKALADELGIEELSIPVDRLVSGDLRSS